MDMLVPWLLSKFSPSESSSAPSEKTKDDVLAYARRLDAAWVALINTDYKPWAASVVSKGGYSESLLMGDVLGGPGSDPAKVAAAKAKIEIFDGIPNDREAFKARVEEFGMFGPSWQEAWDQLVDCEAALKGDRKKLAAFVTLKSPAPGNLANPESVGGGEIAIYAAGGVTLAAVVYGVFRWIKYRTGGETR